MNIVEVPPTGEIAFFAGYGLTDSAGENVPAANSPGFAHGHIFRKVNGTTASDALYINIGTRLLCNFVSFNALSSFSTELISGADLVINSTAKLTLKLNSIAALIIDDAAISGMTAATGVAGKSVFLATQDGGTQGGTPGLAGGNYSITAGAASAPDVDQNGADGGSISFVSGAGTALNGGGTVNGSDGVIRLNAAPGAGGVFFKQAAPATLNSTGALTAAMLLNGIVTSTTAAAVAGTVDTGALMDAAIHSQVGANEGFFWSLINTGPNTFTVTASSGHTLVGTATVVTLTSARFFTRRTAADTMITYRVS